MEMHRDTFHWDFELYKKLINWKELINEAA